MCTTTILFSYARMTLFAPVTLTSWAWYWNLTKVYWRCTCTPKVKFLTWGFHKLKHKHDSQTRTHKQTWPNTLPGAFADGNNILLIAVQHCLATNRYCYNWHVLCFCTQLTVRACIFCIEKWLFLRSFMNTCTICINATRFYRISYLRLIVCLIIIHVTLYS